MFLTCHILSEEVQTFINASSITLCQRTKIWTVKPVVHPFCRSFYFVVENILSHFAFHKVPPNFQHRCMTHIMNLIVQDGLKNFEGSVQHIRHVVRWIRLSTIRGKKFKEFFISKKLKCQKCLCLDIPTRWNTTYLMLSVAAKYERCLISLLRRIMCICVTFKMGEGLRCRNLWIGLMRGGWYVFFATSMRSLLEFQVPFEFYRKFIKLLHSLHAMIIHNSAQFICKYSAGFTCWKSAQLITYLFCILHSLLVQTLHSLYSKILHNLHAIIIVTSR